MEKPQTTPIPFRNHLQEEKSPYLLQHAENPVDWYPWGPEAFEKAKREDKPVFLSIGYSTCHWCHVMAHESFEDSEVGKQMNETFVSIKVDREERPDLDHLYMTVCQRLTGSGGWPLTVLLTPEKKPFFAGTYFPKESRFGRIGLLDLIPKIRELWTLRRAEVLQSAESILTDLQETSGRTSPGNSLNEAILHFAFQQLSGQFDPVHGGFGKAPKFPTSHHFFFLLRYGKRTGNRNALDMVEKSLRAMRLGGMYDQIGFGFHRYSVDAGWRVPHFEKMLYDQALLALAYTEAYQAAGREEYQKTACEILTYVLRDLADPVGGFCSSEDADSEGVEGKFYLWREEEIRSVLSSEEAETAKKMYHFEPGGNFPDESTGRKTGTNLLYCTEDSLADSDSLRMEEIRRKLLVARSKRIRPHRDDKILTDWNGLLIAALARAGCVFKALDYEKAARKAVDFLFSGMQDGHGKLLHRYRDGEAAIPGYLSDYAFLIWGLLELYQASLDTEFLRKARKLNERMLEEFWDETNGGFYFSSGSGEPLLVRQKEIYDGAIPSGNSVAIGNLLRLGFLTSEVKFEKMAWEATRAFSGQIAQTPVGYTHFLTALDLALDPASFVCDTTHCELPVSRPED